MRNEALWSLDDEDAQEAFDFYQSRGDLVVSYSLYGTEEDARHAFVWRQGETKIVDPVQKLVLPRRWAEFESAARALAADGFYAAYVSALGEGDQYTGSYDGHAIGGVFERLPPGTTLPEPPLVGTYISPSDYKPFLAQAHQNGYFVRSLGLFGQPRTVDFRDAGESGQSKDGGKGLQFVGTIWPMPAYAFGNAVHLVPNHKNAPRGVVDNTFGHWWDRWEVDVLSTQAYPVYSIRSRHAAGLGSVTLSLWHDVRYFPWREPHPLTQGGDYLVSVVDEAEMLPSILALRQQDVRPISIGASGSGANTLYHVTYGRVGSEDPLARTFAMRGPREDGGQLRGTSRRSNRYDKVGAVRASDLESMLASPGLGRTGGIDVVPRAGEVEAAGYDDLVVLADVPQASATEHPETAQGPNLLDQWVLGKMRATGARHAQLVVVLQGALQHSKAYTLAEQGYPIATLEYAMRLGSLSKVMTSLMAFKYLDYELGVDTPVADARLHDYGSDPIPDKLRQVTLRHLLQHNAGFFAQYEDGWDKLWSATKMQTELLGGEENLPADVVNRPGDLSRFLRQHQDDDYFRDDPGALCKTQYSNESLVLAGEAIAKYLTGDASSYESAAVRLLSDAGVDAAEAAEKGVLFGEGLEEAIGRGESPGQSDRPSVMWNPFGDVPQRVAPSYGWQSYYGGAGAWCIPLTWMAKLLAAMSPATPDQFIGQEQFLRMAAPSPCPGDSAAQTWLRQTGLFSWSSNDTQPVIKLAHNGNLDGGSALIYHHFPDPEQSSAAHKTVSFCLALNQSGFLNPWYGQDGGQILARIAQMSFADAFPPGDLFDEL